jgi:hypothetical protein
LEDSSHEIAPRPEGEANETSGPTVRALMRRHLDGNKKEASVVVLERNGGRHGYTVTYGLKGREKTMRRKKMEGKRSSPCARVKHTAKVDLCRVFFTKHTAKGHLCRVFYTGARQSKRREISSAREMLGGKKWRARKERS